METKALVNTLSQNDQVKFVRYLSSRNKRKDAKNVDLFKAFLNQKEDDFKHQIGAQTFYVYKKRLSERLLDFIAQSIFESEVTDENKIIKQLLVAQKLFTYQEYKAGFKVLKRAENEAQKIGHYSLLNEIYYTLILNAHHNHAPDQGDIFQKFEANKANLKAEEALNMAYAVIRRGFNAVEFQAKQVNLNQLISDTFLRFGISETHAFNFQSLFQLAEIADIKGAYQKNYHAVDLFIIDKIAEIENGPQDTEKHLSYHIDLLYLIANIYFRKKDFDSSLKYLDKMKIQMQRFNSKFYDQNFIRYTNLEALNLNFKGQYALAANRLDQLFQYKTYQKNKLLNPYLTRIMIHIQQHELNAAKSLMTYLQYPDKYYEQQIGLEWLLNKKYIEILLHIELGNIDYVDSKIKSLIRQHKPYFLSFKNFQILPFLNLVKAYYHDPLNTNLTDFNEKIKATLNIKPSQEEDVFLICFYAWLKAKIERKPLYTLTLELINA